jgi:flagellar biosynthetic protein FliQ
VSPDDVITVMRRALEMVILVSGPFLLTALLLGTLISLLQSVTQIQEQTLTFVPKFVAVMVVMLLTLPWMMNTMTTYATELFLSFFRFVG